MYTIQHIQMYLSLCDVTHVPVAQSQHSCPLPHQLAVRAVIALRNGRVHVSEDFWCSLHRCQDSVSRWGSMDRTNSGHPLQGAGEVEAMKDFESGFLSRGLL